MKKARKFINPFLFSFGFYLSYIVIMTLIHIFDHSDYGGLGYFFIFILTWCYLLVPLFCLRYTKIIKDQKLKYLFGAYNLVVLSVFHTAGFIFSGDAFIFCLAFIGWVAIWTFIPLALRAAAQKKKEMEEPEEKPCCETNPFLQNKKRRIVAVCLSGLYLTSLVFSSEFLSMLTFQNFRHFFSLMSVVAIFVFLILANKSYPLKNLLLPIAFGVIFTNKLYAICSALFSSYVSFVDALSFVISCLLCLSFGAMFIGAILKSKCVYLLKYGSLASSVLITVSYIKMLISLSADFIGTLDLNYFLQRTEMFLQPIFSILFYMGIFILFPTKKTLCEKE